jgi:hypothetical protein
MLEVILAGWALMGMDGGHQLAAFIVGVVSCAASTR